MRRSRKDPLTQREIDLLTESKHPRIVSIYGAYKTTHSYYIAMELASRGTLTDYMARCQTLPTEDIVKDIIWQVNSALLYLHNKGIAHRDVKTDNVLCMQLSPVLVKLSDFGLAKVMNMIDLDAHNTYCGTTDFMAPEIRFGITNYNVKVDMWALGVMMFYILSFKFPCDVGSNRTPLLPSSFTIRWERMPMISENG
ncbi:kinase-like protein, partial [Panus rudis PR-1116 ss-1]